MTERNLKRLLLKCDVYLENFLFDIENEHSPESSKGSQKSTTPTSKNTGTKELSLFVETSAHPKENRRRSVYYPTCFSPEAEQEKFKARIIYMKTLLSKLQQEKAGDKNAVQIIKELEERVQLFTTLIEEKEPSTQKTMHTIRQTVTSASTSKEKLAEAEMILKVQRMASEIQRKDLLELESPVSPPLRKETPLSSDTTSPKTTPTIPHTLTRGSSSTSSLSLLTRKRATSLSQRRELLGGGSTPILSEAMIEEEQQQQQVRLRKTRQDNEELEKRLTEGVANLLYGANTFDQGLEKDKKELKQAYDVISINKDKLGREKGNIQTAISKAKSMLCLHLGVVLFVFMTLLIMVFFVRLVPVAA